ncbi:hypothetical protein FA10DRAFT_248692 [Acaromyces ingoldii]|uniref:Uncharacterized protein n=1 Tax=Acaromyces ingoldii TaxID=215250 RepID=A0A316YYH8_9BASI|nr:hypothetical protein FA10DRAFT_248692 [Acaromyces ingoldii]PWN94116.1 hypothetical protein FA10DRAFT_248692 [Acaromyces ingoldii]
MWTSLASASLVFLILYAIVFAVLTALYATGRIKVRSRYSVLYFHVIIRLASQGCGVAFGNIGYDNVNLLVAYFVLGAEGYFTLVLCTARFLVSWHNHHFGDSWLEARGRFDGMNIAQRMGAIFSLTNTRKNPLGTVHWLLIAANALIIAGGSSTSAVYSPDSDLTPSEKQSRLTTAKALRATGQVIFFILNVVLFLCILYTIKQARAKARTENKRVPIFAHPTLLLLYCTFPFLCARGIFGICQALIADLNYFNTNVYDANGLSTHFVIIEAILATMDEWVSCAILLATFYTSRNDPPKPEIGKQAFSAKSLTDEEATGVSEK